MNKNRVVTITLNPALDLTGSLAALSVGGVNLVNTGSLHPAGKGVNVAKVLADLGAEVTVTGFLGRDNETPFCQLFKQIKANDQFIRVNGATRINVKLVEEDGRVSDINFPGITISAAAISVFEQKLFALAADHDFFVLSGSLPDGISAELCASWIAELRKMKKKVLFDSSRAALASGVNATPWLIKPNHEELCQLLDCELTSTMQLQEAGRVLADKGIDNIVISLGEDGVMWLAKDDSGKAAWLSCQPPTMKVVSTVGAGDSLVAGLCWGYIQQAINADDDKWDREQILSFATALSALAVTQVSVGVANINAVIAVQQQVSVHSPMPYSISSSINNLSQ